MRFTEFNKPVLNEKMMDYTDWRKTDKGKFKYAEPLIDAIIDGEDPTVAINMAGEDVDVMIASSEQNIATAKLLADILSRGGNTKELQTLKFEVQLLEDDEPTGETMAISIKEIVKDEKISGQIKINLGNIAELVLGCAVTAKYEKEKADVTVEDVISVATRLAQADGSFQSTAGKDSLVFQASVPRKDKKAFYAYVGEDPKGKTLQDYGATEKTIKEIGQHIENAVKYVNTSPRVLLAVDKAIADPNENEVEVISDGGNAEQQKITKVDLKIMINPGPDGQPQRLNLLSIKAGAVKQFGQVSGYEFERLNAFFQESVGLNISPKTEKKFARFNTALSGEERKQDRLNVRETNYYTAFTAAYDELEKHLKTLAKGNQEDLLERVYTGLLHHATRGEEGVEMVILTPTAKKAFSELTFGPELRKALDDYHLVVNRGSSEKMHILQIHGIPKTADLKKAVGGSKELLVQYRSFQGESAGVRNVIEMGDLLKDLADWEKIKERQNNVLKQWGWPETHMDKKTKAKPVATKAQPVPPRVQQEPVQQEPQPEPEQFGMPSGMTNIAPVTAVQPPEDELGIMRRNAGITVE